MDFRLLISIAVLLLPWTLRRLVLVHVLGYTIDRTARIGYSLVCPKRLEMGLGARIGHLTFVKPGVELLRLGEGAGIGNLNWVSGEPLSGTTHYQDAAQRNPELVVHDHAAITNRHFVDCSASVSIGRFSTFAGLHSVILTHSVDLTSCKQSAKPVSIGEYCFVGAASVLLAGAALPDFSVLGAQALLNKHYTEPYYLYAGSPARPVKQLSPDRKYFSRTVGYID
jgi:carbonic anhydrase/acetyltransferase-like protein (isoleucine patch superfamily)